MLDTITYFLGRFQHNCCHDTLRFTTSTVKTIPVLRYIFCRESKKDTACLVLVSDQPSMCTKYSVQQYVTLDVEVFVEPARPTRQKVGYKKHSTGDNFDEMLCGVRLIHHPQL